MKEAEIIARTLTDRVTVTREVWNGIGWETETVYQNLACALSRTVQSESPKRTGLWADLEESEGRLELLLPAGTRLLVGDRAAVCREGQVFRGICSATLPYPSHAMATFYLQEVVSA